MFFINNIVLYTGSILIALWGVAHIIPTKSVVKDFGNISENNKKIITMEWIAEGVALCFVGILLFTVNYIGGYQDPVSITVNALSAFLLIILAGITLFTGSKTSIIPIKICPIIKTVVVVMICLAYVI